MTVLNPLRGEIPAKVGVIIVFIKILEEFD
jgi:hypothetical protein